MDQYPILLEMEKVIITITIKTTMKTTMPVTILVILVGVGVASLISLIKTRKLKVVERKKEQEQAVAKLVETLKEAGVPVLPHPLKEEEVKEQPQVVEVKVEEPVVIPVVEALAVVLQETVTVGKPVRTKKARKPRQKKQKAKQI